MALNIQEIANSAATGTFIGTEIGAQEIVALIEHDSGHPAIDSNTSKLTRDFLETVKETSPLYFRAAQELAHETYTALAELIIDPAQKMALKCRKLGHGFYAFSMQGDLSQPIKHPIEFVLTQAEAAHLYKQAQAYFDVWIKTDKMQSFRAQGMMRQNVSLLAALSRISQTPTTPKR